MGPEMFMSSHYKDTICAWRSHMNAAEFFSLNETAQKEIAVSTPWSWNILQNFLLDCKVEMQ